MQYFRRIKRDKVITISQSGMELVGIYFADTDGSEILMETTPDLADSIVDLWNSCEGMDGDGNYE